jgi:hypothetical protein
VGPVAPAVAERQEDVEHHEVVVLVGVALEVTVVVEALEVVEGSGPAVAVVGAVDTGEVVAVFEAHDMYWLHLKRCEFTRASSHKYMKSCGPMVGVKGELRKGPFMI